MTGVSRIAFFCPLTAFVIGLAACEGSEGSDAAEPPGAWIARTDPNGTTALVRDERVCHDCIELERLAVIGDADGPGYIEYTEDVVRDSAGNFWLGQWEGTLKVYNSEGAFLRSVGRKGQGPGEFNVPAPVYTDRQGRVHVFDSRNARRTFVLPDFSTQEGGRIPSSSMNDVVPLADGERYVINAWVDSPELLGFPIHIIEGTDFPRSFGISPLAGQEPISRSSSGRRLAVDEAGRIFSAKYYDYVIEVWDAEGQRLGGFNGGPLNDGPVEAGIVSRESPPVNRIASIRVDSSGRVWVISRNRKANWLDYFEERLRSDGRLVLEPRPGSSTEEAFQSRIDVIDLNRGAVVASHDHDGFVIGFIGDGLLLESQTVDGVLPQLVVWGVSFEHAGGDGRQ